MGEALRQPSAEFVNDRPGLFLTSSGAFIWRLILDGLLQDVQLLDKDQSLVRFTDLLFLRPFGVDQLPPGMGPTANAIHAVLLTRFSVALVAIHHNAPTLGSSSSGGTD